jgi:hypothetical protein
LIVKIGIKTYMRPRDVKPYQVLLESLVRFHGNQTKACAAIHLSDHSFHRLMRDDELSVANARKIMAGYKAMKNQESKAA